MTGSDPAQDTSQDSLLTAIREARHRKGQAEEDLRTLIAYAREFIRPRPYRLIDLAEAAGMSVSGVRTAYTQRDIERVAELLRADAAAAAADDLDDEAASYPGGCITILDYVRAVTGDKPSYTGEDHWNAGVGILGGCEICFAVIASYNAYPARSGFWRCAGCIGDDGYATVEQFAAASPPDA